MEITFTQLAAFPNRPHRRSAGRWAGAVLISGALMLAGVTTVKGQSRDLQDLSAQLAHKIAESGKKSVAVVDFTDLQGNVTELGRFLAEELSVSLSQQASGFTVIDRTYLKAILREHKLAASGLIDPATASKLGQIAGVQGLVTGTIVPLGDNISLSVKVLDAGTEAIIGATTTQIPRTEAINALLSKSVSPNGSSNDDSYQPQGSSPASATTYARETKDVGPLEVTLKDCRSEVEGIRCDALVTNRGDERQYCLYSADGDVMSRIVDSGGNVYVPSRIWLAEKDVSNMVIACADLPSTVPVTAALLFGAPNSPGAAWGLGRPQGARAISLPREGARLPLVEFRFDIDRSFAGRTSMLFRFQNVPVTR